MQPIDSRQVPRDPPIQCEACQSALRSPGRETVAFLLLDRLTIPIAGCEDHRDQFSSVCGLTAERRADLLEHLPAGGISCPACRHARHSTERPVIPVDAGAVGVMACQEHLSEVMSRFRTGVETRQQLSSPLDTSPL